MTINKSNFEDRRELFKQFSLGYLNVDINTKFALIALVGYLTQQLKLKKPGVTHYQVLAKLNQKVNLDAEFIENLSIVCEDFSYGCKEFPTFGIQPKDMAKTIIDILKTYLPF